MKRHSGPSVGLWSEFTHAEGDCKWLSPLQRAPHALKAEGFHRHPAEECSGTASVTSSLLATASQRRNGVEISEVTSENGTPTSWSPRTDQSNCVACYMMEKAMCLTQNHTGSFKPIKEVLIYKAWLNHHLHPVYLHIERQCGCRYNSFYNFHAK